MRKVLITIILSTVSLMFSNIVVANGYGHGYRHQHHYRPAPYYNWVAPVIIGGTVGYGLYRYSQPVIIQQAPILQQATPESYRYVTAYDPECSCYKQVLIPN